MLCSPKELGLGADHSGIMEIHGDFTPGESFVEALGLDDTTMDVEVTSNRGDLLSHIGIARELAAEGDGRTRACRRSPAIPGAPLAWEEGASEVVVGDVSIRIDDADLCARYLGAVVRGVRIGPSPAWLQERLRGAGARPINNVVDATNYVMLELGQPLHAFDLARLGGSAIVVRRARPEEKHLHHAGRRGAAARPGHAHDLRRREARSRSPASWAGRTRRSREGTTDILLECALFDPKSVRATRRALGMSTDASYRFERGVDPEGMRSAVERAVALILATAGGEVDGPVLDVCPRPFEARTVSLRLSRIAHVLGVPFDAATVRGHLEPLGFTDRGRGRGRG